MSGERYRWLARTREFWCSIKNGQSGQSLILFAVMLTTLVAGTGLVIDTGYAYQQRRLAQNAADGAALAAAQYLAQNRSSSVSCSSVRGVIQQYVTANLPGGTFTGSYLAPGGSTWDTTDDTGCTIPPIQAGQNPSVVGVALTVTHVHNTFFMRVVNLNKVTVKSQATAKYGGAWQVPLDHVLPIILDDQQWADVTGQSGDGQFGWNITPESPSINSAVQGCPLGFFNSQNGTAPGPQMNFFLDITTPINCGNNSTPKIAGFDWGPLNVATSNSDSVTKCLMDPSCVGTYSQMMLSRGDYVQISGGTRSVNFFNELATYAAGRDMVVPLVSHADIISNACPNCRVQVKGLAWIHIFQTGGQGSGSYFTAAWDDPRFTLPIPGSVNPGPPSYQVVSVSLVR